MEGFRVHEWGAELRWESVPVASPGPGEVLVEVEACGVGLTVLNCINGDLANDPSLLPRVPGHELVGRVVEVGSAADETLLGRRVVAYFYLICGSCEPCLAGHHPQCSNLAGWVGVHRDGGYAQKVVLPVLNVVSIPDGLDPVAATVVPDAVATPVHIADRAAIGAHDRVAVIGAGGGVGIHMVQVARHAGAQVVGLDIDPAKLEKLEALGIGAVDSSDLSGLAAKSLLCGGPPTVVIDFLGTSTSTRWALDNLGMGGRLVALTTFRDRPVEIESRELVFRELSLLGSRYASIGQLSEAALLVAKGDVEPAIGMVRRPTEVGDIHAQLRMGTLIGRGAIDWRMC